MRQILHKIGPTGPIEMNTLFIQPTRWCALDCPGCYVVAHDQPEQVHNLNDAVLSDLLHELMAKGHHVNQFTISGDNLSKDPEKKRFMAEAMGTYLSWSREAKIAGYTSEFHATFNTPTAMRQYEEAYPAMSEGLRTLDVISFSNIPAGMPDEVQPNHWMWSHRMGNGVRTFHRTKFNYNHLIPENVSSLNINEYVEKMEWIGGQVDSIHLVISKTPTGKPRNELVQLGDRTRMKSDLAYIGTMMKRLSTEVRRKINVDGCLQDTIKYRRSGFGCSANISKFQLWPDGSVSGCPYAHKGSTGPGQSATDILDNFRKAAETYEFRGCHLPDVHSAITGGDRLQGTA